jgi:hypothetical protein
MKRPLKSSEVIEKIVKETGGTRVFNQEGRNVVKIQSEKVTLWLGYHPTAHLRYTIDASFCGLHSHQAYKTMKRQIRIAKNINKICDDLTNAFCAIMDKSLEVRRN